MSVNTNLQSNVHGLHIALRVCMTETCKDFVQVRA